MPDQSKLTNNAETLNKLFQSAQQAQKAEKLYEAERLYEMVLAQVPGHAPTLHYLGILASQRDDFDKAEDLIRRSLGLIPDNATYWSNLGHVLRLMDRFAEAVQACQRALSLNSRLVSAYNNLGLTRFQQRQPDAAMAAYRKALSIDPVGPKTNFFISAPLLQTGKLREGWKAYEWRWQQPDYQQYRISKLPKWHGEDLRGHSILVTAEQGIGDEIMFAGCLSDLLALTPDRCVVCCEPRLIPLISRSFSGIECLSAKTPSIASIVDNELDCQISIGDLGGLFRGSEANFPERKAYFEANKKVSEKIRSRYDSMDRTLIVGISWKGGVRISNRSGRSIPLTELDEVLCVPGVQFINLQYGGVRNEVEAASSKSGVSIIYDDSIDPLEDLDLFAAQIAACDLVISIDNSTVHLAGALGHPVWTLLPFNSDFRWMLDRDDSPWYPSMRLFRQQSQGEWGAVIRRVAAELTTFSVQFRQRGARNLRNEMP